MSRRSHVILLISVCVLLAWGWFVTAPPAPTTGNTTAPTTGNAAAPTTGNVTAPRTGTAPVPATGNVPPTGAAAPQSDWFAKVLEALPKLISGWALVVLVVLLVFRDQLVKLLQAVTTAMEGGGVTLDVATVKVQVAERLNDIPDDRPTWFSSSPLEVDDDSAADRPAILSQIEPQIVFQVTDYVAEQWSNRDNGGAAAVMRRALEALAEASRKGQTVASVKTELLAFAELLEATRFLEAEACVELFSRHTWLGQWLDTVQPKDLGADHADFLILHCAGVAHAQKSDWPRAKTLLDKIMWKDKDPFYVPAGDTWLACAYHAFVEKTREKTPDLDLDSNREFFTEVDLLLAQGRQLVEAMRQADWTTFSVATVNVGYYKREIQKVIATIASTLAELSAGPNRERYFIQATETSLRCVQPIDDDDPSPLDYNNLADLYRQRGDFVSARAYVDRAFGASETPDPTFCNTRALIFERTAQPASALRTLDLYGADEARRDGGPNAEQYLDNQILAAKLTFSLDPRGTTSVGLAVRILEDARRFLDEQRARLTAKTVTRLAADIDELLGFAYLQLPGSEDHAVEAFERLRTPDGPAISVPEWRRRLGRARALTRLARTQRRNFSAQVAIQHWRRASATLVDAANQVKAFGVEVSVPLPRRIRHLRLRLDTAVAVRVVAEEGFAEGERQAAQGMLDQESPILVSLRTALRDDGELRERLGDDVGTLLTQVRACEARRSFLAGRILVWSDPSFNDAGLIGKVEASFDAARGAQSDLDCLIDLELGEMLLAAALAGKGDPRDLYRRALIALERATTSNVPSMRAQTVRTLADAYARRSAILRKGKPSAKPA